MSIGVPDPQRTGRDHGFAIRRLVALIVLLPFLAASFLGNGTMPRADGQGRVSVVLCGSDAPVDMIVGPDGALKPVAPGDGAHASCAWSLHGQPVLAMGDAPMGLVQRLRRVEGPTPMPSRMASQGDRPTAQARAPPA